MADWLTKKLNDSEEKGETKMGKLMMTLFNLGRAEDAEKAANDSEYRQQLYREFQIA